MSPSPDKPAQPEPQLVTVAGIGACVLPREFALFTGTLGPIEVHDAREPPAELHRRLAAGAAVVLTGPYRYVDAIFRYCQRFERGLVADDEVPREAARGARSTRRKYRSARASLPRRNNTPAR